MEPLMTKEQEMGEAIRKLDERKRAAQCDPRTTIGAVPGVDWSRDAASSPDQRAMSPREMTGESPSTQPNAKKRLATAIVHARKQAEQLDHVRLAHLQDAAALSALLDALPTTLSTPAEFGLNRLLDRAGY